MATDWSFAFASLGSENSGTGSTGTVLSNANNPGRQRLITLSSQQVDTSDRNTVTLTLPKTIINFEIMYYNIPYSWYPVNARNNIVKFSETAGDTSVATATLTPGVYTEAELLAELKTRMDAASPNSRTYTFSVSSLTKKIQTTVSTGEFRYEFANDDATNAKSYATQLLGFDWAQYTSSSSVITAPFANQILRGTEDVIYIAAATTDFSPQIGTRTLNTTFTPLIEVPVTGSYGDIIEPPNQLTRVAYPIVNTSSTTMSSLTFFLAFPDRNVNIGSSTTLSSDSTVNKVDLNNDCWSVKLNVLLA